VGLVGVVRIMGFDEGGRVMGIIIIDECYESEKFLILIGFWDIRVNQFSIHPSIDPSTATRIACRLAPKVRSARSVVDMSGFLRTGVGSQKKLPSQFLSRFRGFHSLHGK
jgi:hypothetical protein